MIHRFELIPLGVTATLLLASCGTRVPPQAGTAISPARQRLRPAPASVADRLTRSAPDLHFDLNSRLLKGRERRKLEQAAPALESLLYEYPDLIIVIEGYSDDSRLIERNDRLALKRAETVRRALLELSFPEERLQGAAFAYGAPQCAAANEDCRSSNRLVLFRAAQAAANARGSAQ